LIVKKGFKRLFFLVLFTTLLFFSITTGYQMGKQESSAQKPQEDPVALVGALNSKEIIGINTIIETTYRYKKCGHEMTFSKKAGEDMLGLGVVDFLARFGDYRIIEFTEEIVRLEILRDQYCDQHYLLKMIGDTVMILRSDIENEDFVVIRKTKLTRKSLDNDVYLILKRGKLFNSLDDIETYIDGLNRP